MTHPFRQLLLAFTVLSSASLSAAEFHPYVSAFGGIEFASQSDIYGHNPAGVVRDIDVEYKNAFAWGLALGTTFYQSEYGQLSAEFEYASRELKTDSLSLNHVSRDLNGSAGNELAINSFMLNLVYETPELIDRLRLSAGIGAGVAHLDYDINYLVNNARVPTQINLRDTANPFAYQLMVGASYAINDDFSVLTGLKYFAVRDHDIDRYKLNNGPGLESVLNASFENSWTWSAGVRYTF
ncbi:MAG: outer membrane protein [Scandinavium sp.]|uniref:outer membrane protein n=1 Tax=Scandinavium sp. TaxID=2830653 RepID=UPI003F3943A7